MTAQKTVQKQQSQGSNKTKKGAPGKYLFPSIQIHLWLLVNASFSGFYQISLQQKYGNSSNAIVSPHFFFFFFYVLKLCSLFPLSMRRLYISCAIIE